MLPFLALVPGPGAECDVVAGAGQVDGDGLADAPAGPGDQGDASSGVGHDRPHRGTGAFFHAGRRSPLNRPSVAGVTCPRRRTGGTPAPPHRRRPGVNECRTPGAWYNRGMARSGAGDTQDGGERTGRTRSARPARARSPRGPYGGRGRRGVVPRQRSTGALLAGTPGSPRTWFAPRPAAGPRDLALKEAERAPTDAEGTCGADGSHTSIGRDPWTRLVRPAGGVRNAVEAVPHSGDPQTSKPSALHRRRRRRPDRPLQRGTRVVVAPRG